MLTYQKKKKKKEEKGSDYCAQQRYSRANNQPLLE
jgi:hypothetical protein